MEQTIFTLEKLYQAYRECQRGKKNTVNALTFEYDREKNLIALLHDLQSGRYEISRHICFIVTNPTPREIFAADFRDRIVHHLLCNEIQDFFEADFIPHSYANRKGKGTHRAVAQLRKNIQHTKRKYPADLYYLKLDVESFFRSIDRTLLYAIVEQKILSIGKNGGVERSSLWKKEVLWLSQKIIFHDPTKKFVYRGDLKKKKLIPEHKSLFYGKTGKGLPIGNLTSQFFANVYLNPLDQFVTKTLGIKTYVRYVDDFVLVSADKQTLLGARVAIDSFLQTQLRLRLHPDKVQLQTVRKGIDFLGYILKPNYTLVRQKVVRRMKAVLYRYEKIPVNKSALATVGQAERVQTIKYEVWERKTALLPNDLPTEKTTTLAQVLAAYYGHFSHADSYRLVRGIKTKIPKFT